MRAGTKACCRKSARRDYWTSLKKGYVGIHSEVPNEKRRGRERDERTKTRSWLTCDCYYYYCGDGDEGDGLFDGGDDELTILMSIRQRRLQPHCRSYWLRRVLCKKGTLCVMCCANRCAG